MWEAFVVIATIAGFLGINVLQGGNLTYNLIHGRRQRRLLAEIAHPDRPLRRNVVGRDEAVKDLRALLLQGGSGAITQTPAVTGAGGVGKTTLAEYYGRCHKADYARIEFIRAETEDSLARDLANLADRLDGQPAPNPRPRAIQALEYIKQRTATEPWLIIYDNVTEPKALRGWTPQGRHLHLLVTSRHPTWAGDFTAYPAGLLRREDSIALLRQEAGRDDPGFDDVAKALGDLPLALIQAGEWLREHRRTSAADYLAQVEKLLETRTEDPDRQYPNSYGAVVRLTLKTLSRDARALAAILSRFAPDEIDETAFEKLAEKPWRLRRRGFAKDIPRRVWTLSRNERRRSAAFAELRVKALLEEAEEGKLRMHRATQIVLRKALRRRAVPANAAALLAAVYPADPGINATWEDCRRLTPHVSALQASGAALETQAMSYLLNQAGAFLSVTGDIDGSIEFRRVKVTLDAAMLPKDHRDIAVGRANLGIVLAKTGDFDAAEAELQRAIAHDEEHRPGSLRHANHLGMLGNVLLAKGRAGQVAALRQSLRSYQRSAALYRRLFPQPRQHDARAKTLNNLGTVRDALGQSLAGLRLYEYSLAINEKILSEGDTRLALLYQNTAALALKAGRADQAEGRLEQAMEIWRDALLPEELLRVVSARNAADWLISAYLTRARAGENTGAREAKAKRLCDEFGFGYAEMVEQAKTYPYAPE